MESIDRVVINRQIELLVQAFKPGTYLNYMGITANDHPDNPKHYDLL